ncbi:MAG TPA: hypothetical protein VFU02_07625, partial [Polyangiaceae bacterium]|nr:hypothetical protein [Polyangiaceae bacterium]
MTRETVGSWKLCLGLGVAAALLVACGGGSDRPATDPFPTTRPQSSGTNGTGGSAGEDAGASGGSTSDTGGAGGSGGSGGTSNPPSAPVVAILSPEDATTPEAVYDATLEVSCKVTQAETPGSTPPDPASVVVELLNDEELVDSQAGVEGEDADVYEASFAVQNVPPGSITVRCSATDTSTDPVIGSHEVQAFVDHGPNVTVVTPLPDAAESPLGAVVFEYEVTPAEIVEDDTGAAVELVELTVKGQDFAISPSEDDPTLYRTTIDFSDPTIFPEVPEGSVSVALTATNARGIARAERYDFLLDATGPAVFIDSPRDGAVVGGTVNLVIGLPEDASGINLDTLEVQLNSTTYHYDPNGTWAAGEEEVVFQFEAAALGGGAQITVNVRVEDNAGNLSTTSALFYIDEFGPIVMLDPPNFRAVNDNGQCSYSFDPLGSSPDHAARVDSTEVYRALVWDRTNSSGGSVLHMAGADDDSVQLFVRRPDAPLVVDTTSDGICDDIADADALAFQDLEPLDAAGSPWFGEAEADPGPDVPPRGECLGGTATSPPDYLCDDESDLRTVVHHSNVTSESVVYAIAPGQNSPLCQGLEWELTTVFPSYEGWVCLAARALDAVGNRGVSKPLAVCV